jgi:HK97 family phage portal protein
MGLFDFFTGKKASIIDTQQLKQQQIFLGGSTYSLYNADYRDAIQNGYEKNVDVYAIISDIASRSVEVPLELYQAQKVNIKKAERYKSLMTRPNDRSIMEANNIKKNNLTELEEHPILALLRQPNSYQTTKEFFEAIFSWYLLLGDVGIYAEEDPLKKGKIARLHVIAANDYQIITDGFRKIIGYKIYSMNIENIDPKYFLSFRSFNPEEKNFRSIPRGFSPLQAGSRVLQKANSGEEVAIENYETRGAVGMLYTDDPNVQDISGTGYQDLQDRVYDKVYNSANQGRIAFSNTKMGYLKLSTSNLDLDIRQMSKLSTEQLCRLWHYPYVLLNSDNLTESNLAHFIRRMIINCVIPLQSKVLEKMLAWLAPTMNINPAQYILRFDVDAYPEMKQNFLDAATILEKLDGVLTQDEKRVFMDFEPTNDPIMQNVYIKSNQVPIGSLNIDPNTIGSPIIGTDETE